jgi:histone-binding protein RBBP4
VLEAGGAKGRTRQRLYLSEQTDGSEPNRIVLVDVDVVHPRTAAADHLQGFSGAMRRGEPGCCCCCCCCQFRPLAPICRPLTSCPAMHLPTPPSPVPSALPAAAAAAEHSKSPHVSRPLKTLVHPGEVNRMREVPQHPHVLVTHTDASRLYVWNTDTQPDRTGVKVGGAWQLGC